MRISSITEAIGNTPLLEIPAHVHGLDNVTLYAKLEYLNPMGSVKDRTAWAMLEPGLAETPGADVVELSSGNTAKALAVLASIHGREFRSITNRMKVPEVKDLLLFLGAQIDELPGQSECLDPANGEDPLTVMYRQLQADGGNYLHTDQYFNPTNVLAHRNGTGPEILADLDGKAPDVFIATVGTSGSSAGCAAVLREANPELSVVGLVGRKGDFLPGIRNIDEVHAVGLFDPSVYQQLDAVGVDEAIDALLELVRRCGVLAGPTSGAAYAGALRHLRETTPEDGHHRTAVFIVCDRIESYMSYLKQRRPQEFQMGRQSHELPVISDDEERLAPTVSATDARALVENRDGLVVDLRSPMAYKGVRIPDSINIADSLFEEVLRGGLPFDGDRTVLLVCPVGERSRRFSAICQKLGHSDVASIEGGMVAWRDSNGPLVRGRR